MASITRGKSDPVIEELKSALEAYEQAHPTAEAALYRQNSASVRIRVVDDRFAPMARDNRHDEVWDWLSERVSEETLQEVSVLLLLAPRELPASFMNSEFDDPVPSSF